MTNMLRNKLPRLALLLAMSAPNAAFDVQAAPSELAARDKDDAYIAAAAPDLAAPIEAGDTALAAEVAAPDDATAVASEQAVLAAL
ncbi:MAG: hypothetical protein ABW250_01245, partial [Pyrinomonadaceae bacterium]